MQFRSTRVPAGAGPAVRFREALFRGLAPDGGLYQPALQPDLRSLLAGFSPRASFLEVAEGVIRVANSNMERAIRTSGTESSSRMMAGAARRSSMVSNSGTMGSGQISVPAASR